MLLIDRNLIVLSNKSNSSTITPEEQELLDSSLDVIRARTLSILRRFENDEERKTSVINFLIETEIVGKSKLNLSGADLSCDLSGADLSCDLSGANLSGANLSLANLSRAFLYGANLSLANLSRAFLYGAHLRGANLKGANLKGANLQGANFKGSNLQGADLKDIKWNSKTVWPDKSKFMNAENIPEDLKKELGITP